MRESLFNKILSFLHGASIAFIALGAFATFTYFSPFGLAPALSLSFVFIFISLVIILWIDSINVKRMTLSEMKRQTEILERMEKTLHDKELSDN
ncbi:MAG: hypothetical protein PHX13_10030 [Thiovulaceae bacterium]|nr:hypothetical protein [Sulfurimonadaceae bacterium]